MRIPGLPRRDAALRDLADALATEAAAITGLPAPGSDDPVAQLGSVRAALAVTAEMIANQQRELDRLRTQPAAPPPNPSDRAALTLVDLRDRLRVLGAPDSGYGWVVERLGEALDQLDVIEFQDEGRTDPARHQVMDRRPADTAHPAGTIARSVRSGLLLSGRVLRPQQVVVFVDDAGRGR